MPIYTGTSADGRDIREFKGMFVDASGNYWSNIPFTREQKAYDKIYDHCARYRKTFRELYNQLKLGNKENLPKWVRIWFMTEFKKESN